MPHEELQTLKAPTSRSRAGVQEGDTWKETTEETWGKGGGGGERAMVSVDKRHKSVTICRS
eukprot:689740-Hanusia_phi.AAC.2